MSDKCTGVDFGGGGGAPAPVDSVNGQTGVVVLDANDVGADIALPDQGRSIYFDPNFSDDSQSGLAPNRAKQTIAAALTTVNGLVPSPSPVTPATVVTRYSADLQSPSEITLADGVSFIARNANIASFSAVGIRPGIQTAIALGGIVTLAPLARAIQVDGGGSFSSQIDFTFLTQPNSVGVEIINLVPFSLFKGNQIFIQPTSTASIAISNQSTSPVTGRNDFNYNDIFLGANNSTGIRHDSNATGFYTIQSISTNTGTTGKTGFNCVSGSAVFDFNLCQADIVVENGATLYIPSGGVLEANIIVNAGGTLIGRIENVTGTITNNGTIQAVINGEQFGAEDIREASAGHGGSLNNNGVFDFKGAQIDPLLNGEPSEGTVTYLDMRWSRKPTNLNAGFIQVLIDGTAMQQFLVTATAEGTALPVSAGTTNLNGRLAYRWVSGAGATDDMIIKFRYRVES